MNDVRRRCEALCRCGQIGFSISQCVALNLDSECIEHDFALIIDIKLAYPNIVDVYGFDGHVTIMAFCLIYGGRKTRR